MRSRLAVPLLVLSACATSGPTPSSETPPPASGKQTVVSANTDPSTPPLGTAAVVGADQREFQEIHGLYTSQAYERALSKMDGFETRYPKSPLHYQVENLRGLSLLLTGKPASAAEHFKSAIRKNTQNPTFTPYLAYNLAKAQFEAKQVDAADQSLSQIHPEKLDHDNRLKFHFLKAGIQNKRGYHFEASKELLIASRLVKQMNSESRKVFESSLDTSLQEIAGTAQLEDLYREYEDSPLADSILYRLGSKEMTLGMIGKAEGHLRTLIARFPTSAYVEPAQAALKTWQQSAEVDRRAIGVLLPLKGKYARFGQKNLQAIEQAFKIFELESPETGYSLVIEDSGEEPEQAVKALNRLVMKHHVAAVIGPLLSKGIDQVTRRADELGVPLLSLARHMGTPENYVVQSGVTLQTQAYEIARFAIQNRGLRKFAILHPRDKVGEETAQHFWDAVELFGGQIVGSESYPPNETDFRIMVDKLSGLYYTEARSAELEELARLRKTNQIKKRNRKTEQYFALTPIVEYQAVFIPDEPKVTGQIMPTFAYRDVDHVQFLGVSAWNSPELIQRAQNYAEGALFVDSFLATSKSDRVRKFVENYQTQFGMEASAMDALAHDAALVLKQAIDDAGSSFNRSELMDRIRRTRGVAGVTGTISFKEGQLYRDLRVLSIQGGQIVEETR